MGKKILTYLNPIAQLGHTEYSLSFPLLINATAYLLSEIYVYNIVGNEGLVGTYIIFVSVALIIYFAFRDGIRGGLLSTATAVTYYLYILYSREYTGMRLISGLETTAILGFMFSLMALTIGWLKQTIDQLIIREKHARYEAEEGKVQLQTILQQLPVGVLLINKKDGTLDGNKHMEKIIGSKIPKYLTAENNGRPHFAFKNNIRMLSKEWPIVRALSKGEVVAGEEIEFLRRDKRKIYLRVNAAPIKNNNKEIIAAVSTLYDITQEKDLERRKDDFINMASHELKTPITSMKLYIEMLLRWSKSTKNERLLKMIHTIKNQTERLQELVNDLLDVSRIQTGKLYFNKSKFNLTDLITEAIELLQPTTRNQEIIFDTKRKFTVFADRFRLYQVLTNLITNASKYSPEGSDIILKVQTKDKKVIVSVKDFGIGIGKDQQKKIFDRLYQVPDITEKTFPGLGMGLYISREIIKRHKGNIWVKGKVGSGSTFYFSLPTVQ